MTLSARDRRIITAIERGLTDGDPAWARRFARRARRFERRESARLHPGRRTAAITVLGILSFIALCVAGAHDWSPPWGLAAVTATAVFALSATRALCRRQNRAGGYGG